MLGYDKRKAEKERAAINPGSWVVEVRSQGKMQQGWGGDVREDGADNGWGGGVISSVNSLSG